MGHSTISTTQEFDQKIKNFQKSQMPGILRRGSMGGFRICQYKMQTTDCCRPLFSLRNQNETKIVPLTVFKPWKQWSTVSLQSYILYCPVLEWTGSLLRKCVHKQSYINSRNGSLHQISTNSGRPTFDIFSFITSVPTDRLCKLACFPLLKTHISVNVNEPNDDG